MTAPTALISYSWDSDDHKAWVKSLAERLRADGIDVILDRWAMAPGAQLPTFMERAISDSNFVLVICTPGFKERSDGRRGGVGYEEKSSRRRFFTAETTKSSYLFCARAHGPKENPPMRRPRGSAAGTISTYVATRIRKTTTENSLVPFLGSEKQPRPSTSRWLRPRKTQRSGNRPGRSMDKRHIIDRQPLGWPVSRAS